MEIISDFSSIKYYYYYLKVEISVGRVIIRFSSTKPVHVLLTLPDCVYEYESTSKIYLHCVITSKTLKMQKIYLLSKL